jgi:hypothetical protein
MGRDQKSAIRFLQACVTCSVVRVGCETSHWLRGFIDKQWLREVVCQFETSSRLPGPALQDSICFA